MNKKLMVLAVAASVGLGGCFTRIESGHSGVRINFNGTVEQSELGVGFHQTIIGDVRKYVSNEISFNLDNLHPQTKDKTLLHDMDLSYTYTVSPAAIADLFVRFKGRDFHDKENGENYPMASYISSVVTTATTDIIAHYNALEANENREKIRDEIKKRAMEILKEEKLSEIIHINQIFVKNLQIDQKLLDSSRAVIAAQNELKAKEFEVQSAKKEAERLGMLANNPANLELMRLQIQKEMVAGLATNKNVIYVIPSNMTSLMVK